MSWKTNMQTETWKIMLKRWFCSAVKLFIHGNISLDKYFLNHPPMTAVLKFHSWNVYQPHAYLYWISLGGYFRYDNPVDCYIKLRWLMKCKYPHHTTIYRKANKPSILYEPIAKSIIHLIKQHSQPFQFCEPAEGKGYSMWANGGGEIACSSICASMCSAATSTAQFWTGVGDSCNKG